MTLEDKQAQLKEALVKKQQLKVEKEMYLTSLQGKTVYYYSMCFSICSVEDVFLFDEQGGVGL